MEEKRISASGFDGYYRVGGTGKTVVLIHGFCEDGRIWNEVAGKISNHCQAIIPDLPGFGNSGLSSNVMSMKDQARYINLILQNESIEEDVVVLGHSMGGYIALAYAEMHTNKLTGLGLINSHALADSDETRQNRLKAIRFIENNGTKPFVKEMVTKLFGKKFAHKNPEVVDDMRQRCETYPAEGLIMAYKAMMQRPDRSEVLRIGDFPVLVIAGEDDEIIPKKLSLEHFHKADVNQAIMMPDVGHLAPMESAWEVAEELSNFLHLAELYKS